MCAYLNAREKKAEMNQLEWGSQRKQQEGGRLIRASLKDTGAIKKEVRFPTQHRR